MIRDEGEGFWNLIQMLTYTQHGGSGYGYSLTDVLELEIRRLNWLAERLEETRQAEAKAIKDASSKK